MIVGYRLVKEGKVFKEWGGNWGETPAEPNPVTLPNGTVVYGMTLNGEPFDGYYLEAWEMEKPDPTAADVIVERVRRLGLGFDHDFGEERGVHHIGTTEADLVGWGEVTQFAQAVVGSGIGETPINIVTDTGPVTLTAQEWLGVLIHAAQVRQPIWTKSFELQAMEKIPLDYEDEKWWS